MSFKTHSITFEMIGIEVQLQKLRFIDKNIHKEIKVKFLLQLNRCSICLMSNLSKWSLNV